MMISGKMFRMALATASLAFICQGAAKADVRVTLEVPQSMIHPHDEFWLYGFLHNSEGRVWHNNIVIFALEISGEHWFWPSWRRCQAPDFTGLDFKVMDIPLGTTRIDLVPPMRWPDTGGDSLLGIRAHGAIVTPDGVMVWGEPGSIEFGYGPAPRLDQMVPLPPGSFQMGSPLSELCRTPWDESCHDVTITRQFAIQPVEVTVEQWIRVFGGEMPPEPITRFPVTRATWFDAVAFCNRVSMMAGLMPCYYADQAFTEAFDGEPPIDDWQEVYWDQTADGCRLPTEAEWEYACRAGTSTAYYGRGNSSCGADFNLDARAWYGYSSDDHLWPVAMKMPNAWGLYDMLGNAAEWCWDWWAFYAPDPAADPLGPDTGAEKIWRGGDYWSPAEGCRAASRRSGRPTEQNQHYYIGVGFRMARYWGS